MVIVPLENIAFLRLRPALADNQHPRRVGKKAERTDEHQDVHHVPALTPTAPVATAPPAGDWLLLTGLRRNPFTRSGVYQA